MHRAKGKPDQLAIGNGEQVLHMFKLLAAALLAMRGEHLAHLLARAIKRGVIAESLLEMPYYHQTMEEMLQSALTDIVKQRADTQAAIVVYVPVVTGEFSIFLRKY